MSNIQATNYKDNGKTDNLSFALLTRVQRNELPFISEFLAYYKHLGIDRVYLINTELENRQLINDSIPAELKSMVELIDKNPEDGLDECFNCALPKINEMFLLNVDMDEFLYLNGMSLHEFVVREGWQKDDANSIEYTFFWVMSPLWKELYAPSVRNIIEKRYFFPANNGKSLARTRDIASITPHYFNFIGIKREIKYNPRKFNCFVFHVSSRGIFDILNKVQYGQYPDLKKTHNPKKELYDLIFNKKSKKLPSRFILLAFQSRFTSYVVPLNYNFPKIEYGTNTELLKKITLTGLKDLLCVEIDEKNLHDTILKKVTEYPVPQQLVSMFVSGRITLLKVLKELV